MYFFSYSRNTEKEISQSVETSRRNVSIAFFFFVVNKISLRQMGKRIKQYYLNINLKIFFVAFFSIFALLGI